MEDSYPGPKLNIGCGKIRWPGWIAIDHAGADINCDVKAIPLPDNYADAACAIHVLEHLYEWDGVMALHEWKRVLKPGGKLILELPCMNKIAWYISECVKQNATMAPSMTWLALWGDPRHRDPYMCHRWGYSVEMLIKLLREVGFKEIRSTEPRYHFPVRDMRLEAIK